LRRCHLFFDIIKTRIIYRKIIYSWDRAREFNLKKQIFDSIKLYRDVRVQHHSILELQVETLLEEGNKELLAIAIASLQINAR
jgi:hypothetical protein